MARYVALTAMTFCRDAAAQYSGQACDVAKCLQIVQSDGDDCRRVFDKDNLKKNLDGVSIALAPSAQVLGQLTCTAGISLATAVCVSTGCLSGDCCSGTCRDLSDDDNCGQCGNVCSPADQRCVFGKCVCTGNLTNCNGKCVDLKTDPANCGACGVSCTGYTLKITAEVLGFAGLPETYTGTVNFVLDTTDPASGLHYVSRDGSITWGGISGTIGTGSACKASAAPNTFAVAGSALLNVWLGPGPVLPQYGGVGYTVRNEMVTIECPGLPPEQAAYSLGVWFTTEGPRKFVALDPGQSFSDQVTQSGNTWHWTVTRY